MRILIAVLLMSAVAVGQSKPTCHLKAQPKSGTMEFYNWLDEYGADCGDLIKIQEDEWSVLVIAAKDSPSAVFKTKKEAVKWAEARLPRMPKPIKCNKGYHPVDYFPRCRPDWDSGEMGTGNNYIGPWDMLNACVADGVACTSPVEMLPKPETKPADITNLMEKIAPTDKHEINGGGPCGEAICDWPDHPERIRPYPSYITGTVPTLNLALNPPSAEYHDHLDDKGVYHADFTDPTGKWRCQVVGTVQGPPSYGISEIKGFTLACAETHEVQAK